MNNANSLRNLQISPEQRKINAQRGAAKRKKNMEEKFSALWERYSAEGMHGLSNAEAARRLEVLPHTIGRMLQWRLTQKYGEK